MNNEEKKTEEYTSYINTNELAKRLSVAPGTIRVWKADLNMPHHKFRGAIRYDYKEVLAWLDDQNKEN